MANLKDDEIVFEDIQEYLNSSSDFAFEMKTLKLLNEFNCRTEHGGTYTDPVTEKDREFDIRATLNNGRNSIKMAVECKNLRKNYPLVISGRSRRSGENYHYVCTKYRRAEGDFFSADKSTGYKRISVSSEEAGGCVESKKVRPSEFYPKYQLVGKNCDQVGRYSSGKITANDSDVYGKWSQAVNSAYGLLDETLEEIEASSENIGLCIILPLLIIPDETLWVAEYDDEGRLKSEPKNLNRCQYYIGKQCEVKHPFKGFDYNISHLEIMTFSGLKAFMEDGKKWEELFLLEANDS